MTQRSPVSQAGKDDRQDTPIACMVAIWVAVQRRAASSMKDLSSPSVQPESIRTALPELLMRLG